MLFNKESYGNECLYKYFIGYIYIYKGNALPSPLCKNFKKWKHMLNIFIEIINAWIMNLLVNDKEILEK